MPRPVDRISRWIRRTRRGGKGPSATTVIGGAMVGFEEQVFKNLPRVEELVRRGQPVRGLAADGSALSIDVTDDLVVDDGFADPSMPTTADPH